MTVVAPDRLEYRDFPGRRTSNPFWDIEIESTVRQVVIEPVDQRSPHRHPHSEEIIHVLAGRGRVWIDGTFHPVAPGTWYRIPRGTPHCTLADAGERLELVCFFPHADFANNIEELDLVLDGKETT